MQVRWCRHHHVGLRRQHRLVRMSLTPPLTAQERPSAQMAPLAGGADTLADQWKCRVRPSPISSSLEPLAEGDRR